jgi:hypothetical protein
VLRQKNERSFGERIRTNHLYKVSDDWKIGIISKRNDAFVNHKSKNSHHGGTSVVQFNGTLLKLGLFIKVIPSEVDVSVTEVTGEFGKSWNLTHEGAFEDSNGGDHLHNSGGGDVVVSEDGSNSIGERVEGVTSVVDGSWKVESSTGGDLAKEGQHTDASVLDLDVTKTFESLFGGITREKTERIEEAKRRLGTKFFLERVVQGSAGGGLLRRSESSGGGDKGGEDGGFHVDLFLD